MRSGTILIMLYESPDKMSLGLNHHFLTTSRNVEQRLRSQPLISYSAILLFQSIVVSSFFHIAYNARRLCEVVENRSEKFRFRRHVAKANFYLLIYEKKPIKLAFADYEAQTFNYHLTRHFAKPDRKSTRLNSSHVRISYAVFC